MILAHIEYVKGDATKPISLFSKNPEIKEIKYILHICNNINRWGLGFVLALSKKWPKLKENYHSDSKDLGTVHFYQVEDDIIVGNMIAQHGIKAQKNIPPIRYSALRICLKTVAETILENQNKEIKISVHMPRIGCGLAGGKWEEIEPMLIDVFLSKDVSVVVYDL